MHLEYVHYYRTSSAFESVAQEMMSHICVSFRDVFGQISGGAPLVSSFGLAISALRIKKKWRLA